MKPFDIRKLMRRNQINRMQVNIGISNIGELRQIFKISKVAFQFKLLEHLIFTCVLVPAYIEFFYYL